MRTSTVAVSITVSVVGLGSRGVRVKLGDDRIFNTLAVFGMPAEGPGAGLALAARCAGFGAEISHIFCY